MREGNERFRAFRLTLLFALMVFVILFVTMALVFFGTHFLMYLGLVDEERFGRVPLFLFSVVSIGVGTVLSVLFSRRPLKPLRSVMDAVDRIASGDYSVRIDLKGPEEFRALSSKFNHMAEELGSVELLRSDFVNNFSHEFKTPIVSIRGFAKALKWDDLTEAERDEYLDIILDETERLSSLSANVLYLSKIEKQTIVTGRKRFNLSEQLRLAAALVEPRLSEKQLALEMDGGECLVDGNEEMLRQVWLNLLDNAVKFSPTGGKITIRVKPSGEGVSVKISDEGIGMSPETKKHIFDKFYQGDRSHATGGNGLGLSIVKKIVDLHGGHITIRSSDKGSTFEVFLKSV